MKRGALRLLCIAVSPRQLRRFICHQNYICCFNGRIRTKPTHCNTNICTGKDRSVIDTITNKSQFASRSLFTI